MRQTATTPSPTPRQFCEQQPTYPQQQLQQQEQTPPSRAQPRESAESWVRLLSEGGGGEEWNANLSLDSASVSPAVRSSLGSTSLNTPNVSSISDYRPGRTVDSRCSSMLLHAVAFLLPQ